MNTLFPGDHVRSLNWKHPAIILAVGPDNCLIMLPGRTVVRERTQRLKLVREATTKGYRP